MTGADAPFDGFLTISSTLTGFSRFRLHGTGQAQLYFSTLTDVVGAETIAELTRAFTAASAAAHGDEAALERQLRIAILSHEKLGPIARNIIKLWFVGTWYQLPADWRDTFGTPDRDGTFVPAPSAYVEGLLWPTIGANPNGAKAPGYGTWAEPPSIPEP